MRQLAFSRLWGHSADRADENRTPFPTDEAARLYRDEMCAMMKKNGHKVRRSSLKGQMRKYWDMGVPCGETCTVYYIELLNS